MRRREPLRTVLRLRRLAERRHEMEVAELRRRLESSRGELEARRRRQQEMAPPPARTDAVLLRALQLSGIRGEELVREAVEEQRRTQGQLDDAISRWSTASASRKSAERLDERRRFEADAVALRASQKALDELVALRWGREDES
jgi:flagellar export protein FliJ